MQNNRLGCLTGSGFFTSFLTIAALIVAWLTSGGQMFSAGALNAQSGEPIGGAASHADIKECSACHAEPWSNETMNNRCVKCHQDVALQTFDQSSLHFIVMRDEPGKACRACHPEHRGAYAALTEFNTVEFPHEALGFSLNGHQKNVLRQPFACSDCHHDGYKFSPASCSECHSRMDSAFATSHEDQFGAECLKCHDGVDRYGKRFDHAVFFALEGKHGAAKCSACHGNARTAEDFQSAPSDCLSCHQKDDAHAGAYGTACGVCHSPESWKPAKFDHNLAAFRLEGKHAEVPCEQCHIDGAYKGTPTACYSCHQKDDEHQGQFGTACEACHNPSGWENATFDHNLSAFKLDGAHANVACEKCHLNNFFKGTPTTCVSCHTEPVSHTGLFGAQCATCHTTGAWIPAQFNLPHAFPTNHGEGGVVSCKTCHPSTYAQYTCYGCHEHNESEVRSKHLEEGIPNYQNCMECHPTGQEGEGKEGGGDDDDD